jgi:hypothetical protein
MAIETYVHVKGHPIALNPVDGGRNNYQGVLANKVPNASLAFLVSPAEGFDIEFQGLHAGKEEK